MTSLQTKDRVGEVDRGITVPARWRCDLKTSDTQELPQLVVGAVIVIVTPLIALKIPDIRKILPNYQNFWLLMPEPL